MNLDRDERDDWKIGRSPETIWDCEDESKEEEDEESPD